MSKVEKLRDSAYDTAAIKKEYLDWLKDKVYFPTIENYGFIFIDLYSKDFYAIIELDNSRTKDGLSLREEFLDEYDYNNWYDIQYFGSCSVLEMMVALARRCDRDIIHDDEKGDRSGMIFWEMFRNLGFEKFTDEAYIEAGSKWNLERDKILETFLERKYRKNGTGGMFPLMCSKNDQRKLDIWMQLQEYLMENGYA